MNYMSHLPKNDEERLADDLQEVARMLRDRRPKLDPLALDAVKLRAMSGARRTTSQRHKGSLMRSRLTAFATAGFLATSTGAALALSGGGGGAGPAGGSASRHQYRPPPPCPPGFVERDHHCIPEKHHH
jgi:hypothetical protein